MSALTLDEALAAFPSFEPGKQAKIQFAAVGSQEVARAVFKHFVRGALDAGWYFDQERQWHEFSGEPPRSVEEMTDQFIDLGFVQRDGKAARELRDRLLDFIDEGQEHAPILKGLYDSGKQINADGELI